jgi:hypothetical protein
MLDLLKRGVFIVREQSLMPLQLHNVQIGTGIELQFP